MKGYIVTLMNDHRSVDLALRCAKSAAEYDVEAVLFPAVNKFRAREDLKFEGLTVAKFDESYSNTDAVLGNFVTQYRIWKRIAQDNEPAIVLEHDAVFIGPLPKQHGHLTNIGKPSYGKYNSKDAPGIYPLFSKSGGYLPGAHAYCLTPVGARALIEKAKELGASPCDTFLCNANFNFITEIYPWCVEARDSFSTIQKEKGCLAKHNYDKDYEYDGD